MFSTKLWPTHRREHGRLETGLAAGHARPHGPADPGCARPASWLRPRPPDRATRRRWRAAEPGHHLRVPGAIAAAGVDRRRMGCLRYQPEGEVLFDYEVWQAPAEGRPDSMGAPVDRDGPGARGV